MARIRTIKPEFFTSADVVALSPLARLLFVGMWGIADREGRFKWRPADFKLQILPGDHCDIDALCSEIIDRGLVVLYGDGLACIPTFLDHQSINPRETPSKLPHPDACATRADASIPDVNAQRGREGKGKEGEGREVDAAASRARALPAIAEVDEAFGQWSALARDLQIPDTGFLNSERRAALHARLNEIGGGGNWPDVLDRVRGARFFLEDDGKPKRWLNLGWLLKPENFTGLMEGRYDQRHRTVQGQSGLSAALAGLADEPVGRPS